MASGDLREEVVCVGLRGVIALVENRPALVEEDPNLAMLADLRWHVLANSLELTVSSCVVSNNEAIRLCKSRHALLV